MIKFHCQCPRRQSLSRHWSVLLDMTTRYISFILQDHRCGYIVVKYFFEKDLSHLLTLVFVSLSGSRLVLIYPHKCFPVLIFRFYVYLNLCLAREFTYCHFRNILRFFIGGRVCGVRADLGTLVSLKFLFGFVTQRFSFWFVCSFSPIATM